MSDGSACELPAAGAPYAHSRNDLGRRQPLREHLDAVAQASAAHAAAFGGSHLARAAGLWHDVGKYHPDFQRYLLESEAGQRARGTGPDHKAAGARLAAQTSEALAFPIAGHHGGLMNGSRLREYTARFLGDPMVDEALSHAPDEVKSPPGSLRPPQFVRAQREADLFLRMLFSALVDADYLDTERHFEAGRAEARGRAARLEDLWEPFVRHHATLDHRSDPVSRVRADVYAACLKAAALEPGFFRLTVPTGGGKTLSAMGFALRHALQHGMRRVIVAVPYTTITEQTAQVYREAFGVEGAVLEHHSAMDPAAVDEQTKEGLWGRLASENWDAPVVVTTTVQLFESLFAHSTSKCRKLHRIASSVIVLDEAQALPSHLLEPILDVLRSLVENYKVSVVLSTATQPALDDAPGFKGLPGAREIAPQPAHFFASLRRVAYELPDEGTEWSWERAAQEMHTAHRALAIVNTVADSVALFDALGEPDALYLSTLLCGAHRRSAVEEVRERLRTGQDCLLVSTQVVEAGVDIDFPLVLRAVGPLDRIVQAAGRCNREGRMRAGRVVVFRPAEGKMPPGPYRTGADLSGTLLSRGGADLHSPELYQEYFRRLFGLLNLDEREIQRLREGLRFEDVAQRFQMIDEDTRPVVVPYGEGARPILEAARRARRLSREALRNLQPYVVAVRVSNFGSYVRKGLVEEVREGLWTWLGQYDERKGLTAENRALVI